MSDTTKKTEYYFGGLKEYNLDQIESEVLNESIYLDVFAGSDLRLKKNITPIRGALDRVRQLEGVNYQWSQPDDTSMHAGLIAQEVAAVMPELVRVDTKTGMMGIEYSKLNSYLIEAIKDLHGIVSTQNARIQSLEEKLCVKNSTLPGKC